MANSRKIAKAIFLIEWHPPQAALRRRCPIRSARRSFTPSHYEKRETSRRLSLFFGRGRRTWSPLRSGRLVACVPLARTRPSARGFGVDVGGHSRERGRTDVARFPPQVRERTVLVWCCEEFLCQRSGQIATDTIRQSSRICWMSTADSSFFSARAAASFSKNSRLAEMTSFALR